MNRGKRLWETIILEVRIILGFGHYGLMPKGLRKIVLHLDIIDYLQ